jgi:hypothetical protein
VPRPAQDRLQRGPLSALLILLGLLLGSGTVAATGSAIAAPAPRASPGRVAPSAALIPSTLRGTSVHQAADGGAPAITPASPRILTAGLSTRHLSAGWTAPTVPRPQPGSPYYRARAPPAA